MVNFLNQKPSQGFILWHWMSRESLGHNWVVHSISPKKNCSIFFKWAKRVQLSYFIAFFCLKSKRPEPKNLHRSFILWHWRAMQTFSQNWILLSKYASKKIVICFHQAKKGSKFHILLLSFVWKVNYLNQKSFAGVLFCDTEGRCKVGAKIESCFPNQPKKNLSISFERPKMVQI